MSPKSQQNSNQWGHGVETFISIGASTDIELTQSDALCALVAHSNISCYMPLSNHIITWTFYTMNLISLCPALTAGSANTENRPLVDVPFKSERTKKLLVQPLRFRGLLEQNKLIAFVQRFAPEKKIINNLGWLIHLKSGECRRVCNPPCRTAQGNQQRRYTWKEEGKKKKNWIQNQQPGRRTENNNKSQQISFCEVFVFLKNENETKRWWNKNRVIL